MKVGRFGSLIVSALTTMGLGSACSNSHYQATAIIYTSPSQSPSTEASLSAKLGESQRLPDFGKIAETARVLGYSLRNEGNTGHDFTITAKQSIKGQEFVMVVMGPPGNQVDTVRLQAFGIQTKAARQVLQKQAETILASINRGKLPMNFLRQFYAGRQVGDDGVSNGFCNVQVLQMPINPARPSTEDRISLDLIFDKGMK
jgi:hypothetical protein